MKKYNEIYSKLIMLDLLEDDKKIWMTLSDKNAICEIDLLTKKSKIIGVFPNEVLNKKNLYFGVVKVEKKLIFVPGYTNKIAIYSLEDNSINYIPFKENKNMLYIKRVANTFWEKFCYQNYVYLFGFFCPAILRINMNTMEVECFTEWITEIKENVQISSNCVFFSEGYVVNDGTLTMPIACMDAVLELNLETSEIKIIKLNIPIEGVAGISSIDGNNVWILGNGKKTIYLLHWNRKNNKIDEIGKIDIDVKGILLYHAPICTNTDVYLIPFMESGHIYKVDVATRKMSIYKKLEEKIACKKNKVHFSIIAPRIKGNLLKFIETYDYRWYEYNLETEECESYIINFDDEKQLNQYFDELFIEKQNKIFSESEIPLEYFFEKLKEKSFQKLRSRDSKNLIGYLIYHSLYKEDNLPKI